MDWREFDKQTLERHYNPRIAAPDFETHLTACAAQSKEARDRLAGRLDLRYGESAGERLDLFAPEADGAPINIFIHGGYWRALSKDDFTIIAEPLVAAGAIAVIMDYDLCPNVTLDRIVEETLACVAWVARRAEEFGGDPDRIYLSGHSAGAHLAAMALAWDWTSAGLPADLIKGAVLVSGVYDPEPVLHLDVNAEIGLTPAVAARNNALQRKARPGVDLLIAAGGEEPEGWVQQSRDYHAMAAPGGRFITVEGEDHFSIIWQMARPDGVLFREIAAQMGLG